MSTSASKYSCLGPPRHYFYLITKCFRLLLYKTMTPIPQLRERTLIWEVSGTGVYGRNDDLPLALSTFL